MVRIVLVCTGNVCRSPMAEGLLRKMIREAGQHEAVVVESAGTYPVEGAPASDDAVAVAREHGIDIRGHAARGAGRRLVERADLVLTMEPAHQARLIELFPDAGGKIHLLTRFAEPGGDPGGIADPIGLGIEAYRETFAKIEENLRAALPQILTLVASGEGSKGGKEA